MENPLRKLWQRGGTDVESTPDTAMPAEELGRVIDGHKNCTQVFEILNGFSPMVEASISE